MQNDMVIFFLTMLLDEILMNCRLNESFNMEHDFHQANARVIKIVVISLENPFANSWTRARVLVLNFFKEIQSRHAIDDESLNLFATINQL